ncbi:MAG: glucosamine-6-phosphate isomerase [Clostridia bacterium]|nr:glucosamine-6-phosphate isomerase [Clostridia bacterium]
MDNNISREDLFKWCKIPYTELENRKDLKVKLVMKPTRSETMHLIGNMMADEVVAFNKQGKPLKWILPAGPTDEYDVFIERVNREMISLKNLWIFHMDEFLDWEGRPYPLADTYESLEGTMNACFYARIESSLTVPPEQRIWPRIHSIDFADELCKKLGGVDTMWAGIGAKGLVAFNEPPYKYTMRLTLEEYAKSKTRILDLNDDTIVALSQRSFGGCYDRVPPRAITIGFQMMTTAKRAVYMVATGSWKQTVVRVILFSEPTLEYPVTLLAQYIPDITLCSDYNTMDHPMSHEMRGW